MRDASAGCSMARPPPNERMGHAGNRRRTRTAHPPRRAEVTFLQRLERGFVLLNQGVVMLMMMAMAVLVFTNVVTRYVFGFSINWSEELSRYLMVWVAYLGGGLAMREGRHVAIEYLQGLLPPRLAPYARAAVGLLILAFLVVLTVLGWQLSQFAWRQRTPVLGLPQGAVYLALPIGAALFGLHLVLIARDYVRQQPNAVDAAPEAQPPATVSRGGPASEPESRP